MKIQRMLFIFLVGCFAFFCLSSPSSAKKNAGDKISSTPMTDATMTIPHDISGNSIRRDIERFYVWRTGNLVSLEGEVQSVSSHVVHAISPICIALVKISPTKYVEIGVNGSDDKHRNDIAISTCNTITQAIGNKVRVKGTVGSEISDLRARYFISVQELNYAGDGSFEMIEERADLPRGDWMFEGRVIKIYHSTIDENQYCAVDIDQARCDPCGAGTTWATEDRLVHAIVFPIRRTDPIRGDIMKNQVSNHYLGMCQNFVSALNSGNAIFIRASLGLEGPGYYPTFLYPYSFRLYHYLPRR